MKPNIGSFFNQLKHFRYYLDIWFMMNRNSFLIYLNNKTILGIFLLGKVLRFTFFIAFLYFLVIGASDIAGYSTNQVLFFFLTFNLVDILAQFLFREVYRFRTYVVSGDFDLILLKPLNPLFRVLFGGADIIDLITLPPIVFAIWFVGRQIAQGPLEILLYVALVLNGLLISAAFHIVVLAAGIITYEIDHSVMIFRDLTKLATLPIDIYKEPLRSILTYFIPLGIMISVPVKALIGIVNPLSVTLSFLIGILAIIFALRFWNFALTKYTSASS